VVGAFILCGSEMQPYVIVVSEFFGKKANLRLAVLNIFDGSAMLD
jgi:hypothetical protein